MQLRKTLYKDPVMKRTRIPVWSFVQHYATHRLAILAVLDRVLLRGHLILGNEVSSLEEEFAAFCSCKFGIGVGNGTDALFLALKALGVGSGDEVITVPNTAVPTVSAICAAGARPVFVDVDPDRLLMDPANLESRITKRTRCIIPVHLYGQCCDMDAINAIAKAHRLSVLEDCAQATGASWRGKIAGSMSDVAAFSFYPTKILGALGDGGMVVTKSKTLANTIRMLRMYGMRGSYYSYIQGYNSRLDELQAAVLRYFLRRLPLALRKRRLLARRYTKDLAQTPLTIPAVDPNAEPVWYLYVCRHPQRDGIIRFLESRGVQATVSYPYPIHLMPAYRFLKLRRGAFPIAERACREVFSLPLFPDLKSDDQQRVIDAIVTYFQQ